MVLVRGASTAGTPGIRYSAVYRPGDGAATFYALGMAAIEFMSKRTKTARPGAHVGQESDGMYPAETSILKEFAIVIFVPG